ncbi:tumor protein p53-inducible protein 13 isoform X2 [Carassius carassius]|uniref:tumor protein p53-inducible protein 13 isoform X2 n=1 Tax=Carassius carassius TaxID=217509 RepID=UPI002868FCE0|nr:tumor protein p53-inducible protein 13 isoform X2 [Carassius carassius]
MARQIWSQTYQDLTSFCVKSFGHSHRRGPYRPVEAESGEYLYCPPQRWLHNLKIGALVFLYHPCVSAEARRSLAGLARSCLSHYILTPHPWLSQHRPLAVVSWGRSLEMSRITLGVCDWLFAISSDISLTNTSQRAKYNLYLTKPAPMDKPENTSQEMSKVERLKFLKNCCMETLSLIEVQRTRGRTRKSRMVVKQSLKEVELKDDVKPESAKLNHTDTLLQNHTKKMASFSVLTVTQSLSSAKNNSKTTEKQLPQNNVTKRHEYQTDRKTQKKTMAESKKHRIKTDTKAQRSGSECGELGQCGISDSSKSPHLGGPLRGERIPIQRTDEAVWAAGALGFLLVLLTLSVLHTRLYRHWRSSTSLYWHDDQQDYESVGDIIRRRLRMVGRRKRRSIQNRRQECPLLSNSSNEENSD